MQATGGVSKWDYNEIEGNVIPSKIIELTKVDTCRRHLRAKDQCTAGEIDDYMEARADPGL